MRCAQWEISGGLGLKRVPVVIAFLVVGAVACGDRSTPDDRRHLARVRQVFASEFELSPWPDIYLEARYLKGGCPSLGRAEALYESFWRDETGEVRRHSAFVYLNLQDEEGAFCFQLSRDPSTGELETSDEPYY
jgi:hypothetical protein